MILFKVSIPGRPYLKKSTMRTFGYGKGHRVLYSKGFLAWEKVAIQTCLEHKPPGVLPIEKKINLKAVFFFKDKQGEADLSALYEGIQDVLQKTGVIKNDKLIVGHNGSTKLFGFEPHTEVEIYAVD